MNETPTDRKSRTPLLGAIGLLVAGAVAGGVLGTTLSASADPTSAPSASSSSASGLRDPGGAKPVRGDENAVSADEDATLRAAALKAVPGGTVIRIETDSGDAEWEAHMTKADGTQVTVKFDKDKSVIGVQDGMGK